MRCDLSTTFYKFFMLGGALAFLLEAAAGLF